MNPLFLIPVVIAAVASTVVFVLHRIAKTGGKRLADEGARFGLRYIPSGSFDVGSVKGRVGNDVVVAQSYKRGTGSAQRPAMRVEMILHRRWPVDLSIGMEGIASTMANYVGKRDIEFGDRRFDALFLVGGRDEQGVRRLVTPEVRGTMVRLVDDLGGKMYVDDLQISWERSVKVLPEGALLEVIGGFVNIRDSMRRGARSPRDASGASVSSGPPQIADKEQSARSGRLGIRHDGPEAAAEPPAVERQERPAPSASKATGGRSMVEEAKLEAQMREMLDGKRRGRRRR